MPYVVGAQMVQNTCKNIQLLSIYSAGNPKWLFLFLSYQLLHHILTWLLLLISYCMREMLQKLPEGDWLCEECKLAEEAENQKQGKAEVAVQIVIYFGDKKPLPGHKHFHTSILSKLI